MASYNRNPSSPDLTSIELREAFRSPSPAPTYRSTIGETYWPTPANNPTHKPCNQDNNPYHTDNNPYNTSSSSSSAAYLWQDEKKPIPTTQDLPVYNAPTTPPKTSFKMERSAQKHCDEEQDFEIKPEPHDQNHPLYAAPSSATHYQGPRPRPRHSRRRRLLRLLPWLLTTIFFLSTLYFVSLLLGSKFLSIIRPQHVQTPSIHLIINGNIPAGGTPTVLISTVLPSPTGGWGGTRPVDMQSSGAGREAEITPVPGTPEPTTLTLVTSSKGG